MKPRPAATTEILRDRLECFSSISCSGAETLPHKALGHLGPFMKRLITLAQICCQLVESPPVCAEVHCRRHRQGNRERVVRLIIIMVVIIIVIVVVLIAGKLWRFGSKTNLSPQTRRRQKRDPEVALDTPCVPKRRDRQKRYQWTRGASTRRPASRCCRRCRRSDA